MKFFTFASLALNGEIPEWIHCVPFGQWKGHHTVEFMEVGQKEAEEILANFARRQPAMVVVDYEHQSMAGVEAPAAGWIDRLEIRENGVWGHIQMWTTKATKYLKEKEYRYQSPVLAPTSMDPVTGEETGLWLMNVALTNNPFFAGQLEPVVNSSQGGPKAMLQLLISLLGLPATASEKDATDAVGALKTERDALKTENERLKSGQPSEAEIELMDAACAATGLDRKKLKKGEVKAKILAATSKEGFVSAEEHLKVLLEKEQLAAGATGDRAEVLAARAVETGKITPAMKPHLVAAARANYESACKLVDESPVLVPLGTQAGANASTRKAGGGTLSPAEAAICKQLNIKPEDYIRSKGDK